MTIGCATQAFTDKSVATDCALSMSDGRREREPDQMMHEADRLDKPSFAATLSA